MYILGSKKICEWPVDFLIIQNTFPKQMPCIFFHDILILKEGKGKESKT